MEYLRNNPIVQPIKIKENWANLLSINTNKTLNNDFVSPLTSLIKWGQGDNIFNYGFPNLYINGDINNKVQAITGCVATAMAQIMKKWEHPKIGFGYYSYYHQPNGEITGELSAIFGKTAYDWINMPGIFNSNNSTVTNKENVSNLMKQCGISVNMQYGITNNNSPLSLAKIDRAASALINYFGYSESLQTVAKQNFSDIDWEQKIKNELNNGRIILYGGTTSDIKGHAFICDGYNTENGNTLFNFNWGWSGGNTDASGNSFCTINSLIPYNSNYNFSYKQVAVIGIEPKTYNYFDLILNKFSFSNFYYGSSASIDIDIKNNDLKNFSGTIYLAVFDKDDKHLLDIEEFNNYTINAGETKSISFNYASVMLLPNSYKLAVFYKTNDFNGVAIGNGISNNFANVNVISTFTKDIVMADPFTLSKNPIIKNTPFSITASFINSGYLPYNGTVGLGIFDNSTLIKTINEQLIQNVVQPFTRTITFLSDGINLNPGNYLFGIYRKTSEGEIIMIDPVDKSTKYLNVVLLDDPYEPNDVINNAFLLTSLNNNSANYNITTSNANITNSEDYDYYKIELPEGYNYSLTTTLYDSKNQVNTNDMTCDVVCRMYYNSQWHDQFDSNSSGITIYNGGTVYFLINSKDEFQSGSYILDVNIQKNIITTPNITTEQVTNIGKTLATGAGNVTFDGGATVTVRGVCWNTTGSPTINDNKTSDGNGLGSYISNLTGLLENTKYYVRAYATNLVGTSYGYEVSFTTQSSTGVNLLINPSFESWSAGNPVGWTTSTSGSTVTQTSTTASGIGNALQIAATATVTTTQIVQAPNGTFDPSKTYQVSFKYKVTSGDGADNRIWCSWIKSAVGATPIVYNVLSLPDSIGLKGPGGNLNPAAGVLGNNINGYLKNNIIGDWETYTFSFVPPAGMSQFNFQVHTYNKATVIWDDFYFGEVTDNDTESPSIPANLSNSTPTTNSFTLNWGASSDNFGVASYEVYKDDILYGSTSTTSLSITGLIASTSYSMTVLAKDAAGNKSLQSNALVVTTLSGSSFELIMDELNGSTLGTATGITYTTSPNGQGAVFNRINNSRIEYGFDSQIPRQGTLEFLVKVESGYYYSNYVLNDNLSSAQIWGTDCHGGDVFWPGAMKINVSNNGSIELITETVMGQPEYTVLSATNTGFKFNEYHVIGISYGSQGQYLSLDGSVVATNSTYTLPLSAAGNFSQPMDKPTIGKVISSFWGNNQHDGGFNGVLDRFRSSSKQQDWALIINTTPSLSITSPNGGENWTVNTTKQISWNSSNIANVKIEYSTDGGTIWNTIISNTLASAGSYTWTVVNLISANCKIRVSDVSNSTINDVSNAVFSITQQPISTSTDIPMNTSNWFSNSCGAIQETSEGIQIWGTDYRSGNMLISKDFYDLSNNAEIYMKWKVNGNGNYMAVYQGAYQTNGSNFTTGWSFSGSILVSDDTWYYTHIRINSDYTYSFVTSTNGYDDNGGNVYYSVSNTIPTDRQEFIRNSQLYFFIGDNYGNTGAWMVAAEVKLKNATKIAFTKVVSDTFDFENNTIPQGFALSGDWDIANTGSNSNYSIHVNSGSINKYLTITTGDVYGISYDIKSISGSSYKQPSLLVDDKYGFGGDNSSSGCWRNNIYIFPSKSTHTFKFEIPTSQYSSANVETWIDNITFFTNGGGTVTKLPDTNESTISVYPNPVQNELTIKTNLPNKELDFQILNFLGQVVYKVTFIDKTTIKTNHFLPGVYLVKFKNGKTYEYRKILKN